MGEDKCFLNYHGKPQCYHVYEMLQQYCEETFISCNTAQLPLIDRQYQSIVDTDPFSLRGPATGVLTAFSKYQNKSFLVIGCDYPLLSDAEIRNFLNSIPIASVAAAFYDDAEQCYQPVLAWYSSTAGTLLSESQFSLKRLLEKTQAYKHAPLNPWSIKSVDTKEQFEEIIQLTNYNQ
jgi:molybdenum cofactor guanylyltransferase